MRVMRRYDYDADIALHAATDDAVDDAMRTLRYRHAMMMPRAT